ncbi:hypothetical protein COCMIDRAFT_84282 [Bipolaris oryzae ATCC 44560]|uniref:Poly(A) RNA polymerase mitochondrial-like central palm domain-containing protein n=1 Tax=Bipolaris oryzae ATCC 44560 TaxID=930090 RepID=W6ZHV1_COCMI|nr:uncharacterized protein COCMIDRAFT_84282 [Bipolaris oryzae ATCC 44560]EUC49565.1 hypothetical protein COCMIDRAFT_84282 [Bipolaris oryzae ATCC 44560]
MQHSRARLICRAHNRFTPSIALWEHFVRPHLPQRFSSTATGPTQHGLDNRPTATGAIANPQDGNGPRQSEAEAQQTIEKPSVESALHVRRMTTARGRWLPGKAQASIAKNKAAAKQALQEESLTGPEKLLATAREAFAQSKEYEGVVVQPMVSTIAIKESSLPWCLDKNARDEPAMDLLDKEIERFYKYTMPKDYERTARQHVIQQVRSHVKEVSPKYDVQVFGSERNGVAFATSDIDFRLMQPSWVADPEIDRLPPPKKEQSRRLSVLLALFHRNFKNHQSYFLSTLRHARYPLITAQDRNSGIDVQIVLSNDTSMSTAMMKQYMDEIPYLRKLYYVVKTIFAIRGLSDVFRGGFGSYSIFMMLVASIKHAPHERQDAAGALLNFLSFYRDFDTTKNGISIDPVELFDKTQHPVVTKPVKEKLDTGKMKPLPAYMLCLRDPADETNDLGRKGIAIKHVQATFAHLHSQLVNDIKKKTRPSLLGPLVGPSYMLNYKPREKLQEYGRRLQLEEQKSLAAKAKAIRDADKKVESDYKNTAFPQVGIHRVESAKPFRKEQQIPAT